MTAPHRSPVTPPLGAEPAMAAASLFNMLDGVDAVATRTAGEGLPSLVFMPPDGASEPQCELHARAAANFAETGIEAFVMRGLRVRPAAG